VNRSLCLGNLKLFELKSAIFIALKQGPVDGLVNIYKYNKLSELSAEIN
jgi:hypothetical protein